MFGSMGGYGINIRRVFSVFILFNGKLFIIYFYIKLNRDLLLSRKKNLLLFLRFKMVKNV